jgi:Epoxide hydrolase N terminus
MTDSTALRAFNVGFPESELTELRRRVNAARWPERETVTDDSQGVRLAMMQELARYWGSDYDWHKCEAALNALPNFMTEIDGLDIHFIHVRSRHEDALPLIVTHGWPGSVIEQLKIIEPLTSALSRDDILDNITLYWLTNTGVSAARLYWENKADFFNAKNISIPFAMSVFPDELYQAPRSWAERAYPRNLIHYNRLNKGGHFAAWEQPQLFSEEMRASFRSLRT